MKKSTGKIVTQDIGFINNEIKKNQLDEKTLRRIEKFIYGLRAYLGEEYLIKKIGSFAMEGIFNFEPTPVIDLLAIKYLNRDFYKRYDDELNSENHYLDCLCCFHNNVIFKKLSYLFETKKHIDVAFNKKVYQIDLSRILSYTDSIIVTIHSEEGEELFKVSIRVGICSKELPVIICDERVYRRSYALQAVESYRTLNNLLNKKLKYLFFQLKVKFQNTWSKKDLMFAKLSIMSKLENDLVFNEATSMWLSKVYKLTINNQQVLKKILKKKNLHYDSQRFFNRVHKLISLKSMKWVFNKTYQDLSKFLDENLDYAQVHHNLKKTSVEDGYLYFYYDANVYIDGIGNNSYTVKKNNRLFDYLGIKKISKSVYPSEKAIENIVLFLLFFAMDIYYVENKYAKYDLT